MTKLKRWLRPALFIGGGMAAGLLYYHFFACSSGCPITSSPWRTMAYTGLMGWLLCGTSKTESSRS